MRFTKYSSSHTGQAPSAELTLILFCTLSPISTSWEKCNRLHNIWQEHGLFYQILRCIGTCIRGWIVPLFTRWPFLRSVGTLEQLGSFRWLFDTGPRHLDANTKTWRLLISWLFFGGNVLLVTSFLTAAKKYLASQFRHSIILVTFKLWSDHFETTYGFNIEMWTKFAVFFIYFTWTFTGQHHR